MFDPLAAFELLSVGVALGTVPMLVPLLPDAGPTAPSPHPADANRRTPTAARLAAFDPRPFTPIILRIIPHLRRLTSSKSRKIIRMPKLFWKVLFRVHRPVTAKKHASQDDVGTTENCVFAEDLPTTGQLGPRGERSSDPGRWRQRESCSAMHPTK